MPVVFGEPDFLCQGLFHLMAGVGESSVVRLTYSLIFILSHVLLLTCPQASALPGLCRRAPLPGEAILASDTGAGLCRTDKIV